MTPDYLVPLGLTNPLFCRIGLHANVMLESYSRAEDFTRRRGDLR